MGLPPKILYNKRFENVNFLDLVYIHTSWQHCAQLEDSLSPSDLLRHNSLVLRHKQRLWPAINFLM